MFEKYHLENESVLKLLCCCLLGCATISNSRIEGEREMRKGSERKHRIGYTELTTSSQNCRVKLGHANSSSEVVKPTVP